MTSPLPLAVLALVALAACAPAGDVARFAAPAELGPFGVDTATRRLADDRGDADVDVYWPVVDDGDPPPAAAPFLFVQGGLVPTQRYAWIGAHAAARGNTALLPRHAFDLAFFDDDAPRSALAGARVAAADDDDALHGLIADAPALIAGHSLGGVVAAKVYARTSVDEIGALALLSSLPDEADDFAGRAGRVVSLIGSRDGKLTIGEVVTGAAAFDAAQVVVVDGMNHYQLTDDPTQGELDGDGEPSVDADAARAVVTAFVDALLDDLGGVTPYPFDDVTAWPSGAAPGS